jgi:hypothetical protein
LRVSLFLGPYAGDGKAVVLPEGGYLGKKVFGLKSLTMGIKKSPTHELVRRKKTNNLKS